MVKTFKRVARGDERLALIDGWHLLDEATKSGIAVVAVAVDPAAIGSHASLVQHARARGAEMVEVSRSVLEAMSPVRTPSGIAALVRRPVVTIAELLSSMPALVVLAVDMQDPGNVGAVVRSAEAGGATGVIVAGASADPWSWKALRAAMGSTFRLPVLQRADAAAVIGELRAAGVDVLATVPRDAISMHDATLRSAVALVIGGEGRGLPESIIEMADHTVSIPMQPPVESLNAAVAAALLVYEARRQRKERR